MIGSLPTRAAALARVVLTAIVATLGLFVATAERSAIGLLLAPPLYLAWVFVVDILDLLTHRGRGSAVYVARPYYALWLAACASPVAAWLIGSIR
ncbi:MAG TPA: hypothetical protein VJR89_39655 [Polyangiales bacterium]|nr:hypothetical protein [Polyangiales bacterium]